MSCQQLDEDSDLNTFQRWSVAALKDFLRKRGLKTSGHKQELAALAFAAHVLQLPIKLSTAETETLLYRQYSDLLVCDGKQYPDPLSVLKEGWTSEKEAMKNWPPTMYYDICEFILGDTKEIDLARRVFKDYKEKKGFSFLSSGFLFEILYHPITKESKLCYLKADCRPSQNIHNPPHTAWVMIDKESGDVRRGFCTCIAGRGQSCLHVASMLMKIDMAWKYGLTNPSCTSRECSWLCKKPTLLLAPEMFRDMDIRSPKYTKSNPQARINHPAKYLFVPHQKNTGPTLQSFLQGVEEILPKAAVFTEMRERNVQNLTVHATQPENLDLPLPIIELCKTCNNPENLLEAIRKACTGKESAIKEATILQAKSEDWHRQRYGRLTASNFHEIWTKTKTLDRKCVTNVSDDPLVTRLLCTKKLSNKYVKYGVRMEETARLSYMDFMKSSTTHKNFCLKQCGLVLDKDNHYIGASPDGLLNCECHGTGVLEIKCPFLASHSTPDAELCDFLVVNGGATCLKKTHKYYSQIQGQMGVMDVTYCDFWVFSMHGHVYQRIAFDESYWGELKAALNKFFINYLAPVLISQNEAVTGRGETAASSTSQGASLGQHVEIEPSTVEVESSAGTHNTDYLCRKCTHPCKPVVEIFSDRENSIGCDLCGSWFHWKCLGLNKKSKELKWPQWFCEICQD